MRDYDIKEEGDYVKDLFEDAGFEDVRIAPASPTEHIRRWLAMVVMKDTDDFIAESVYYRVEARQGSLGVFCPGIPGMNPILDLGDSGISLNDLNPELMAGAPPNFPPVVVFSEPECLVQLRQLMVKLKDNA